MKKGDLVKHKLVHSLGTGMVAGFKEKSSRVYVHWFIHRLQSGKPSEEVDIMLEVLSEER
jgi:hypothetical protein